MQRIREQLERALGREDLRLTSALIIRGLALVYLIAIASSWVQYSGLVGPEGILPIEKYHTTLNNQFGFGKYFYSPGFFWLGTSETMIHLVHLLGVLAALCLLIGMLPGPAALLSYLVYLSLSSAGQVFFNFQWDALLCETGFMALLAVPWSLKPQPQLLTDRRQAAISGWLFRFLLFKLMFSAGVVKLASGDATWADLSAMQYHFFTQPLPNALSYYIHFMPGWFLKAATLGTLILELAIPCLIFFKFRWRRLAIYAFVFLMFAIFISGNYTFFNLLTLVLVISLYQDDALPGWLPKRIKKQVAGPKLHRFLPAAAGLLLLLSSWQLLSTLGIISTRAYPTYLATTMISNRYGLFARMTTSRPEIIVEGSDDQQNWRAYQFRYKPQGLREAPGFVAPHQPRLDWQMWFASLSNYHRNSWLIHMMYRLLDNNKTVLALLADNPFPNRPPKYVRAVLYDYKFASPDLKRATGNWWQREFIGYYTPIISRQLKINKTRK